MAWLVVCTVLVSWTVGAAAGVVAPGAVAAEADPILDRVEDAVASFNEDPGRYLDVVEGTLAGEAVALVAYDQRVDVHVVDGDGAAASDTRTVFSVRTTETGRVEEFARALRPDATVRVLVDREVLTDVLDGDAFTAADLSAAVLAGDVRVECVWRRVLADPSNARCLLLHVPTHPVQTAVAAVTVGAAVGAVTVWQSRLLELLRWLRRSFRRAVDGVVEEFARNPILSLPTIKGLWDAVKWLWNRFFWLLTTPLRYLRRWRDGDGETSETGTEAETGPGPEPSAEPASTASAEGGPGASSTAGPGPGPGPGASPPPDPDRDVDAPTRGRGADP